LYRVSNKNQRKEKETHSKTKKIYNNRLMETFTITLTFIDE